MKYVNFWSAPAAMTLITLLGPNAYAQSAAKANDSKPQCQSVVAVVMVGKTSCTAALCNTGAAKEGLTGILALAMNRQAIDAPSFSAGVGAMLSTALKQTGCFEVYDADGMELLRKEMESIGKTLAAPPSVNYVVRAAITQADFTVDESTIMLYSQKKVTSSLTIDTKLVSVQSGTVSEAGSYDASSERSSSGVAGLYTAGNDGKRGNPFADVAREAVAKAAVALTTRMVSQSSQLTSVPTSSTSAQVPQPAASGTQ